MKKVILCLPYYAACIILASALWRNPFFLLLGYLGLSAMMLYRWHAFQDLIFYLIPFLLGPMGEAIAIYHGAWSYGKPLLLVPVWLPFAWGCAALYMKKTCDAITERHLQYARNSAVKLGETSQVVSNLELGSTPL